MKTPRIPGAAKVGCMLCASAGPAPGATNFDYGKFLESARVPSELMV